MDPVRIVKYHHFDFMLLIAFDNEQGIQTKKKHSRLLTGVIRLMVPIQEYSRSCGSRHNLF